MQRKHGFFRTIFSTGDEKHAGHNMHEEESNMTVVPFDLNKYSTIHTVSEEEEKPSTTSPDSPEETEESIDDMDSTEEDNLNDQMITSTKKEEEKTAANNVDSHEE
jgi:hypothetical protein